MIVKLADGISGQQVARDLRCAPATVVRVWRRYAVGGEEALLDQRAGNGQSKVDARYRAELWRVLLKVPTEFGWQRPTWTRELLALEMTKRGFPARSATGSPMPFPRRERGTNGSSSSSWGRFVRVGPWVPCLPKRSLPLRQREEVQAGSSGLR